MSIIIYLCFYNTTVDNTQAKVCYNITMNKDTSIRIEKEDLLKLRKLAEKQSRTIKATLKIILKYYLEENE